MRGIPRQAVRQNTPILGAAVRAADIALPNHTCPWNPDMFGVDMSKPGAQAYYDSVFALYASWGVDLVKVDDISRAYDDVQKAEIEAIRGVDVAGLDGDALAALRREARETVRRIDGALSWGYLRSQYRADSIAVAATCALGAFSRVGGYCDGFHLVYQRVRGATGIAHARSWHEYAGA